MPAGSTTGFPCLFPQVLDSIYFSRRFHVRCVAKAVDKAGHVGTPLRSNVVTIGTDSAICHTPVVAGTARGFQAQSFIATLRYLDVKHKEHPNRYEPFTSPHWITSTMCVCSHIPPAAWRARVCASTLF